MMTPVQQFGSWWAKREDLAGFSGSDEPCGAKVRAFGKMIAAAPAGTPLVVGCSADSLMSVYVAAAARGAGVPAHVVTPKRNNRSPEIEWAAAAGATIHEVRPGYPSQYRAEARRIAGELGGAVRWDPRISTTDSADQVANLPQGGARVVVPCGTGAIAAGVAAGLAEHGLEASLLCVCVSPLATLGRIVELARAITNKSLPHIELVRCPQAYGELTAASLPDGSPLDPNYAAKALPYLKAGDVLWVSGCRPRFGRLIR